MSIPLICAYIERLTESGDLVQWTIAVRGRGAREPELGVAEWGLPTGPVAQVSRSRLSYTDSLGVITDPPDEAIGLTTEPGIRGREARLLRPSTEGLLLLYPISRNSGLGLNGGHRKPLYENPQGPLSRDLIGLAVSFPKSTQPELVEAYLEGTVRWRPTE